jgi:hypothetical protein
MRNFVTNIGKVKELVSIFIFNMQIGFENVKKT